jgi:hypothetical protein
MGRQDRREHDPVASAHVDDLGEAAPVEAFGDLRRLCPEPPVHLGVERAPQFEVGVEVGPEVAPVPGHVGGHARGEGPEQLGEREFSAPARAVDVEQRLDPGRGVLAQLGTEVGRAVAVGLPVEHADRDQVVEQGFEGGGGGSRLGRESLGRRSRAARPLHEAQRRGHPDGHRSGQVGHGLNRWCVHRPTLSALLRRCLDIKSYGH